MVLYILNHQFQCLLMYLNFQLEFLGLIKLMIPIVASDGYYVAYKLITLSCILFIEMKFIYCHSCVMFAMKSMSMCND